MQTFRSRFGRPLLTGFTVALVLAAVPGDVSALAQAGGATSGLRPYWHVFAAYTIAILAVGGWAFSIARRLRDVERRLVD
jgi:CcmD family protein